MAIRPEILDQSILDPTERLCTMHVPKLLETVFLVIQKFYGNPEILDQFFRSYQNAVHVPNILNTLFGIWDHNEQKLTFQKVWKKVFLVILKFYGNPEILDQFFRSYQNAVHVPNILKTLFGIWDHNEQKLTFLKFWKVISGHREILWWSRNSGTVFFDPTETLGTFQDFLRRCLGS
jgi:hypothetical protein